MTTQPARPAPSGACEYLTTKKDEFGGWARKFSLFPYPFVTACC
ncbi:MAG: NADH-quinone oxidoreductase subunit B, partial [Gammaproteobacteria bacterium]|nr:NADH-quinone oxidoreductase subunit B [Gammaproteobacteria bacterium]